MEHAGVPVVSVGRILGHAKKGVTEKHYIGKNIEVFRPMLDRLPMPEAVYLSFATIRPMQIPAMNNIISIRSTG
jgi:hypothetical protein